MKIFRGRKVQIEKRPKSGYFFFRTLKNRRAEELRSENGCFGTEIVDFPIGFGGPEARKRPKTWKLQKKVDLGMSDENFQEEESAGWKIDKV